MTDYVLIETEVEPVIISVTGDTIIQDPDIVTEIVTEGIQGPPGVAAELGSIADVDASGKTDGSVLVYNSTNSKWTATTLLEQQIMNGGFF